MVLEGNEILQFVESVILFSDIEDKVQEEDLPIQAHEFIEHIRLRIRKIQISNIDQIRSVFYPLIEELLQPVGEFLDDEMKDIIITGLEDEFQKNMWLDSIPWPIHESDKSLETLQEILNRVRPLTPWKDYLTTIVQSYPRINDLEVNILSFHIKTLPEGDLRQKCIERLALSNVLLIPTVCSHVLGKDPHFREELISCAVIELINMSERFDARFGNKFSTYAHHYIKKAMFDVMSRWHNSPWITRGRYQRFNAIIRDLLLKFKHEWPYSDLEITQFSRENRFNVSTVRNAIYAMQVRTVHLDAPIWSQSDGWAERGAATFWEVIEDVWVVDTMMAMIDRSENRTMIEVLLNCCFDSERDRKMVIDLYWFETGERMTLEAVAAKHSEGKTLSRERVRQIVSDSKIGFPVLAQEAIQRAILTLKREKRPFHPEAAIKYLEEEHGRYHVEWYKDFIHPEFEIKKNPWKWKPPSPDTTWNDSSSTTQTGEDWARRIVDIKKIKKPNPRPEKILKKRLSLAALTLFRWWKNREELLEISPLHNRHPVQLEILLSVLDGIEKGHLSWFIHVPARVGKTPISIELMKHFMHYLREKLWLNKRIVFVVPTLVILDQVPKEIQNFFPELSVSTYFSGEKDLSGDVLVTTFNSLSSLVEKWILKPDEVGLLILDEEHKADSAVRQDIINCFQENVIRFGMTATSRSQDEKTEEQSSEKKSVEKLLKHQYYRMSVLQAIEYELIAPYQVIYVLTDTDLSSVRVSRGDYVEAELSAQINTPQRNALIVELYKQCFPWKKAIVYCGLINHSNDLSDAFLESGVASCSIHSQADDSRAKIESFKSDKYDVVTNPLTLVMWFNLKGLEVIIFARPFLSPFVVWQVWPRGQTLNDDKVCSYVVEFIDFTTGKLPLTYEQYLLADHRKTIKDSSFTLHELRSRVQKMIQWRWELVDLPTEILGNKVVHDPDEVDALFYERGEKIKRQLQKKGVNLDSPPDDWASIQEICEYANIDKDFFKNNRLFKILLNWNKKAREHVKKYKTWSWRPIEYVSPEAIGLILKSHSMRNLRWESPAIPFRRNYVLNASPELPASNDVHQENDSLIASSSLPREALKTVDRSFISTYSWSYCDELWIDFAEFHKNHVWGSVFADYIAYQQSQELPVSTFIEVLGLECGEKDFTEIIAMLFKENGIPPDRLNKWYIHQNDHWGKIETQILNILSWDDSVHS